MFISQFRVENYKSFRDSGVHVLEPGFNVIIGQNNSGKTAVLEGLSLGFADHPHRSTGTVPLRALAPAGASVVHLRARFTHSDIVRMLARRGVNLVVPVGRDVEFNESRARLEAVINSDVMDVELRYGPTIAFQSIVLDRHGPLLSSERAMAMSASVGDDGRVTLSHVGKVANAQGEQAFGWQLAELVRRSIYAFRAERLQIGRGQIGVNPTPLAANASNLPQALHALQSSNPARYRSYEALVRNVLPEILAITVPLSGTTAEIRLWFEPTETERDDLAVLLEESGTGTGQVLAMLYVLITADEPRVFLIDEPQSFLHPGALRRLLAIFQAHSQHQYVLSTHSPVALAGIALSHLLVSTRKGTETSVESMPLRATDRVQALLADLGVRVSDVFGAENVLWVEGRTEELCVPMIISRVLKRSISGTVILGVKNTGDLFGRNARVTIEIYNKLSKGASLLPTALAFVLDREERSAQERADIEKHSGGKVHFLPRRMFENYLLVPEAIAAVANSIEQFRVAPLSSDEVRSWLESHAPLKKYATQRDEAADAGDWRRSGHAKRLLSDLFSELSETRVHYNEVEHGRALTAWLLDSMPDEMREIAEFIDGVLSAPPA